MIRPTTIAALQCECDLCHYRWVSVGTAAPEYCRNRACRSREWNGKKQSIQSHVREIKLPAPRKPGRPRSITLVDVRGDRDQ